MADVALQPDHFLVSTDLVSKDHDFCSDAAVVDLGVLKELLHLLLQLFSVLGNDLRRPDFDKVHQLHHAVQLVNDVSAEVLPLKGPSLHELGNGPLYSFFQAVPYLLFIQGLLLHSEDLRIPGQRGHTDIIVQTELFLHLPEPFHILLCQRRIVFQHCLPLRQILVANKNIHLASGDRLL